MEYSADIARKAACEPEGASLLIREHNNYFKDYVGRGVWQLLVGGVVVIFAGVALVWWRNTMRSLAELAASPAVAWMAAGVFILTFGQLLDEHDLWAFMLEGLDPKAARRAVEECFELVGQYLFTVGLLEYLLLLRRSAAR